MGGASKLIEQCRKPSGWWGRFTLWRMNISHSKLTDWGLSHSTIRKNFTVLDVGCGGGATVRKLAAAAGEGKIYGLDHSEESVVVAKRNNAQAIESGRVEILQGSVSQLPFADKMFDLVTAVETHFFWPNLSGDVREVYRILKHGGKFLLIAEVYKGGRKLSGKLAERYVDLTGMTLLTVQEHRKLLEKAGYVDVQVVEEWDQGWICAVGGRP